MKGRLLFGCDRAKVSPIGQQLAAQAQVAPWLPAVHTSRLEAAAAGAEGAR